MPIKNRVRYWRHKMGIEDLAAFALVIDHAPWLLERWEEQKIQPSLEALCRIKIRLKKHFPDITLDELIDYYSEEQGN